MHAVMGSGRLIAGRYRLQGPIGRGAMGIVWRGRDELLARDVAVKEVQITAQASPAEAEAIYRRTLREARTAARLSHPGVVTVFDVVEENGSPWIVMELVNARSLDRVITEEGPLPPLQAAELGGSLAGALASAHAAGVLHRDVKPSNVLVTDDFKAVLTDFGIATFTEDPGQTLVGMVVGTPGFTAPERVRGDAATPASDLWSLGATLYAAVEGRGPFDRVGGATAITVGVAREDAPQAPSAGPLGPVIDALLSRDPGTRPDATTASRLLADAATAAAAAASRPADQGAAFLDPPVFAELSMAELTSPADALDSSLGSSGSNGSGQTPLVAAAGIIGLGAGADLSADAGVAVGVGAESGGGLGADELSGAGLPGVGLAGAGLADAGLADAGLAVTAAGAGAAGAASQAGQQARQSSDGGPVLWQPLRSASRTSGADDAGVGNAGANDGGPGGAAGSGGSGAGGNGGGIRFLRRGGPAGPTSGRWRLMVAGAGIAAIALAAIVGWDIYTHTATPQALNSPTVPGITVPGGSSGSAHHGPSGSGPPGHGSGSTPASGPTTASNSHPAGSGNPTSGSSGKPGSSPSSSPGSPSPSSSASSSPSPSPSPSPTGPVLPPGYVWHRFTAAVMGSAAGFEIGMPSLWRQSVTGLSAYLNEPVTSFHLTVSLAPWTYAGPLAQAQYLERKYAKADKGYKALTLGPIGFKAVGGFKAASAAELKFRWTKTSVGTVTEMVVLVTLTTKSGAQPYTFTLWAPSATFGLANGVFQTAMTTFRPLPS
jgi:eukaryotic-like serine/threonine-protein kinase